MEWIFPQEYASLSESMDSSMAGLSYFGELLVVALTPAICEEALHRGLLQYSLRGIKKKWVMLLLMGVYFGAFHMSIVRFLPMMMMGIVLSYVRMKTDNMFYSSLFHFVHNASTIVASIAASFLYMFSQGNAAAGSGYATETYIGMYLIEAALMPIGLYMGSRLLMYQQTKSEGFFPKERRKKDHCKNRNSDHSADPWRTVFPWYWYDVKRIKSSLGNFAEMSKPGRKQVRFMIE